MKGFLVIFFTQQNHRYQGKVLDVALMKRGRKFANQWLPISQNNRLIRFLWFRTVE